MPVNGSQPTPLNVVGSSTFGIYPKINAEKTINMFVSDEWLVNYAGYQKRREILTGGEGRGLFHSIRGQFLIAVISSGVYKVDTNLNSTFLFNLETTHGEVSIDENLSGQICIVDGRDAWIYYSENNSHAKQTLLFNGLNVEPNYVVYHNTFFLISSGRTAANPQNWYAYEYATDTTIILNTQFSLQTKPDTAIAVKRIPGRGNNVLILGNTVAEVWTQVGGLENYRRISSFNIDYGCVSIHTIASNDNFLVYLGQNENNAPTIMMTDGSKNTSISTDGIDKLLQTIERPDRSTAFFYRQDGHLFYHITFYDEQDNVSLFYDFTTKKFFHAADECLNYYPARQIVYFNEKLYFVSLNDGCLYEMGNQFVTYNYSLTDTSLTGGNIIPRIRVCSTIRNQTNTRFRIGGISMKIEQGHNLNFGSQGGNVATSNPQVEFSFSKNGNQSFGNISTKILNSVGKYRNELNWYRLGHANEFTAKFRFDGFQRFVVSNAIAEVY
jgi:hypothetical protein